MSDNLQRTIDDANSLARSFYLRMGYVVPEGYRFDEARHPQERMCWQMARDAYEALVGTDLDDVLSELED